MPKKDINQTAFDVVRRATGETTSESAKDGGAGKNQAAVSLGRLGGRKGGAARAAALSPEDRRKIALKAAQTRWQRFKKTAK